MDYGPRRRLLTVSIPDFIASAEHVLGLLESIPFEVAALETPHFETWNRARRKRFGFADGQQDPGWACAFRGAGHDRLVSRRWLDHGPWRVLRGANDVTMVQFHDLDADADEAYRQGLPGHERMGISNTGGYLQSTGRRIHDLGGLYDRATATLELVIHGREVTQSEMLDACWLRWQKRTDPEQPIRTIAYHFIDEHAARHHLHEMWLRELECWAFGPDGSERRLDLDHVPPPPVKPDWVQRLERS